MGIWLRICLTAQVRTRGCIGEIEAVAVMRGFIALNMLLPVHWMWSCVKEPLPLQVTPKRQRSRRQEGKEAHLLTSGGTHFQIGKDNQFRNSSSYGIIAGIVWLSVELESGKQFIQPGCRGLSAGAWSPVGLWLLVEWLLVLLPCLPLAVTPLLLLFNPRRPMIVLSAAAQQQEYRH